MILNLLLAQKKLIKNQKKNYSQLKKKMKTKEESILHTIAYTSKILFPKYPCHLFPVFTFIQLLKKHKNNCRLKLNLRPIPNKFYDLLIRNEVIQSEHVIFVSEDLFDHLVPQKEINWVNLSIYQNFSSSATVNGFVTNQNQSVLVQVLPSPVCQLNSVFVKENFFYNFCKYHSNDAKSVHVTLTKFTEKQNFPKIAIKASVFLFNTPYELPTELTDQILQKYFQKPRFLSRNYIFEIDLNEELLGAGCYSRYHNIFFKLKKVYLKCVNLESQNNDYEIVAIVAKNLTTLDQVASINSFISKERLHESSFIENCPTGLKKYSIELKNSILPFLPSGMNSSSLTARKILPLFLIQGERGSGKFTILSSVVKNLGIHMYSVDCSEIISTISSQTEAKIKIVLNRPNLCEPLLICLQNFEVFGVDNEGREDLRIISTFQTEILELFAKKHLFPVIIVALSNQREVPSPIQRIFLETIKVLPPTKDERIEILKWLEEVESSNNEILNGNFDEIPLISIDSKTIKRKLRKSIVKDFNLLEKIGHKTQGFVFGDLKLLFENSVKEMKLLRDSFLEQKHFEINLTVMQSAFSDSLGAPKVPKVLWSDIGGLAKLKDEIQSSIGLPLKHMHLMGKNMRRSGILLYGPPGCGKTLVAKAVATECNLSFLSVQGPELLNMYVGQSEQNVREVFARARSASPCVIFLDELDSLAPNRGVAGDSGGVMDRVVSQLLAEMDGMCSDSDPQKQIFILAATNRPGKI